MPETELAWIRNKLDGMERVMTQISDAVVRLARLEERHGSVAEAIDRAFTEIAKVQVELHSLDTRMHEIEKNEPMQNLASGWVVNVVWAAAGMAAVLILKKFGVM